ncbi:ABC-three component system middle component 8 [Pseudarthrobacter oxydans]|uniref:ABC-three component system middle component 8 n=1 Tax=Pseudarthrobacter oxydans TaxID=1671 RepID=UPI0031B63CFB
MLRPTKHSHPDKTVVAVAAILLKYLRSKRSVSFEDARARALGQDQSLASLVIPALNLLYLFGLIEYRRKNDTLEYVGP